MVKQNNIVYTQKSEGVARLISGDILLMSARKISQLMDMP